MLTQRAKDNISALVHYTSYAKSESVYPSTMIDLRKLYYKFIKQIKSNSRGSIDKIEESLDILTAIKLSNVVNLFSLYQEDLYFFDESFDLFYAETFNYDVQKLIYKLLINQFLDNLSCKDSVQFERICILRRVKKIVQGLILEYKPDESNLSEEELTRNAKFRSNVIRMSKVFYDRISLQYKNFNRFKFEYYCFLILWFKKAILIIDLEQKLLSSKKPSKKEYSKREFENICQSFERLTRNYLYDPFALKEAARNLNNMSRSQLNDNQFQHLLSVLLKLKRKYNVYIRNQDNQTDEQIIQYFDSYQLSHEKKHKGIFSQNAPLNGNHVEREEEISSCCLL